MHDWKLQVIRKQTKGSRTPGSQKTRMCQTNTIKKFLAGRERSYKYKIYSEWDRIFNKR